MNQAVVDMLAPYNCKTPSDYKNALKEIIQAITLLGLSRQGFFNNAAFYGGTALRIGHGLNRFSEDMDFTLLNPDPEFLIDSFLKGIEEELKSYGLDLTSQKVEKKIATPVESAFLKGNTLAILMTITAGSLPASGTHKNELLKVKLEVDTDPPVPSGENETLFLTSPIPFNYRILKLESLFAGKLHAVLCRQYPSGRVKGRDYYDFIWYMNRKVRPDLRYLEAKLKQSGAIKTNEILTLETVKTMLIKKVSELDIDSARADVAPFIKDRFELEAWSADFFKYLIDKIKI